MFNSLTLHGGQASLLWGYRQVAVLTTWRITKKADGWHLTATLARADRWQCQQAVTYNELLFEAPRDRGRWCWELKNVDVGTTELRAILGNPLQ